MLAAGFGSMRITHRDRHTLFSEGGTTSFYPGKTALSCYRFLLLCTLFLGSVWSDCRAQVTLVVDQLPQNTSLQDSIYVVGSFNDWNPADPGYRLRHQGNSYSITMPAGLSSFHYKFTRGSWATVEGSPGGKSIPNRIYNRSAPGPDTVRLEIRGWEGTPVLGSVTFHLKEIPENTPHDASIYVAGTFNGWLPGDPQYKLQLQPDSTYKLTIPTDLDTIWFKFTRGNWASVECRSNGRPIFNRTYIQKQGGKNLVEAEVAAWEDLIVGNTSIYAFLLLMAAVQGIFLILAINGLQHRNKKANTVLSILILLVSLSLFGRLASYQSIIYNIQPKLLLLSDAFYFLFGPLFYLYMLRLLTVRSKSDPRSFLHFVPAILHLIIYLFLIVQDRESYMSHIQDQDYYPLFAVVGFAALLFNFFYWLKCNQLLRKYQEDIAHTHSFEENLTYLSTFVRLMAICLCLWAFSYAAYPLAFIFEVDPLRISELSTDMLWLVFSVFTYFLGFYAMAQPEIFTLLPAEEVQQVVVKQKEVTSSLPDESLLKMKDELTALMKREKPYRNPKLSLQELAEMMDSNIHTISRLINEGYDKNFYDFINEYRIEEFKELIAKEQYRNKTLLALALEVGFSSKTTFYRAFKKSTGETPRKYFSLVIDRDFGED